jgi:hypothetical protein
MTDDNFQNLSLNESFKRVAKVAEERAAFIEQLTDHQRGCAGRDYTCTCSYDDAVDNRIEAQAAEIERLREHLISALDTLKDAEVCNDECGPCNEALAALEQSR